MATSNCERYVVEFSPEFDALAHDALRGQYHSWPELKFAVDLELSKDPKGIEGEAFSGIEQIATTPVFGRRMATDPPLVIWYLVHDAECRVYPLIIIRVAFEQP